MEKAREPAYFHSVRLDYDRCRGCTNCIKRCPTEAIRVRDGKARILEERCIDCGECIRVCPNHAKLAVTDPLARLKDFRFTVALPAPSFYAQFKPAVPVQTFLRALLALGFDDIFEVPLAAEAVSLAIRHYLRTHPRPRPLVSSACPAVVRLMQVRFPALLHHIVPIESPMEIAARLAKAKISRETGLPAREIGCFFISPCPAKVTVAKQPVGSRGPSAVDGVLSMSDVVGAVLSHLAELTPGRRPAQEVAGATKAVDPGWPRASGLGIGWGRSGGENLAIGEGLLLAVDGIHNVISVLTEVEKGRLSDVDYIEAQACIGGCIGGALTTENPYVARVRLRQRAAAAGSVFKVDNEEVEDLIRQGLFELPEPIQPRPVLALDQDVVQALRKLELLEETVKRLPGLDCGACGSPNCRALAEDIARGAAVETDCIFLLREKVQILASEMVLLAQKLPPAMGQPSPGDSRAANPANEVGKASPSTGGA